MLSDPRYDQLTKPYFELVARTGEEYFNGGISAETRQKLDKEFLPREDYESYVNGVWK